MPVKQPNAKPEPPSPDQLAMAYRQLRRPHWPDTLDAALAHPLFGNCIRGTASSLNRSTWGRMPAAPAPAPAPGRGAAVPVAPMQAAAQVRRPARFDARRAAANDFDVDTDD